MAFTPVTALPVALMHLSDSMSNTLDVFFESRLCPLNIRIAPPADAYVGIFDLDHPKSREEADAWLRYREDDHVILVSLQPIEKDGAICLTKPIKPKALLAAFEQILAKREQTSEPRPTRIEPEPKPKPARTAETGVASKTLQTPAPKKRRKETTSASSPKTATKKKDAAKSNDAAQLTRTDKSTSVTTKDAPQKAHGEAIEKPEDTSPHQASSSSPSKAEKQSNVVNIVTQGQGASILPDASLDTLLQKVNWQLDYGDVNKARQMLEKALDENPKQSILHHEILQLYGWTSDHEHFHAMYEKLDMNEVPYAEKWMQLKDFFDQID